MVHTGSRSDPPLTSGPCLLREAPGGLVDWCQQQELRRITSMRPIWQSVLDQELTTLALLREHLRRCGVVQRGFKQLRVDAILVQADKKTREKVLALSALTHAQLDVPPCPFRRRFALPPRDATHGGLAGAAMAPVLSKFAVIAHDSPTVARCASPASCLVLAHLGRI